MKTTNKRDILLDANSLADLIENSRKSEQYIKFAIGNYSGGFLILLSALSKKFDDWLVEDFRNTGKRMGEKHSKAYREFILNSLKDNPDNLLGPL